MNLLNAYIPDGDGYLGSYAQLLVVQELCNMILNIESEHLIMIPRDISADKEVHVSDYFDDIMSIGTGG